MRKIEKAMCKALQTRTDWSLANTAVEDGYVYLFGTCIAKYDGTTLFIRDPSTYSYSGSRTTCSRRKALRDWAEEQHIPVETK